jgi:NIMA (never in mitosis gene a)-related kinase
MSDIWSLGCVLYETITLKPPFRAEDMEGLFKKVTRGIYQRLPSEYSQDLSTIIRSLLQINSELRPSCQKILSLPQVSKKMKHCSNAFTEYEKSELLKTIRGDNIFSIGDLLPKSNYHAVKIKKAKGVKSLIESTEDK